MSETYDVYKPGNQEAYKRIKRVALSVAKKFPGLSSSAFFEEVKGSFYPRPDEYDMRGAVLRMVAEGELVLDGKWKIRLVP